MTEWRSGQAGHLTLSDDDVTAVVQGRWKRINTLQHYKVKQKNNHNMSLRPPPLCSSSFLPLLLVL